MPVADQASDLIGDLRSWLAHHGDDEEMVATLDRIDTLLRRNLPADDAERHGAHVSAIRAEVRALVERLGKAHERWDDKVIHETTVFSAPVAQCARSSWQPAVEDLDAVRRLLGLFDPALPLRLVLARYHVERFGPGTSVPFAVFTRTLFADLADAEKGKETVAAMSEVRLVLSGAWATPGTSLADARTPRVAELDTLRVRAREALRRATTPDGDARIPSDVVADVVDARPAWVVPPASVAFYLQWCGPAGRSDVVLNGAHTGWGRGRSRALHLIEEGAGPERSPAEDRGRDRGLCAAIADGAGLTAELPATLGLSMNRRLPGAALDLDYPAVVSKRPPDQRIRLGDLAVTHDDTADMLRLVSTRHGSTVTALHLGMTADIFLPPVAQLLTQAFGGTWYVHPMAPVLADGDDLSVPTTVVRRPRITLGHVVIQRTRWEMPAALAPTRHSGESDADFLLRLTGWLDTHGIPSRFFLRFTSSDLRSSGDYTVIWKAVATASSYKPTYIDVSSWWLVQTYERILREPQDIVIFEEALPPPDEAPVVGDAGQRVTEFLVEIGSGKVFDG